jgi:2-keto-3-deoxy-L-rhamnonate aldolase RhmA
LRTAWLVTIAAGSLIGGAAFQQKAHLNPVIDLLVAKKPAFGLYAPANPRVGGRGGGRGAAQAGAAGTAVPTTPPAVVVAPPAPKTMAELAKSAFDYKGGDYIFDGTMEISPNDTLFRFDSAYARFQEFSQGMTEAGSVSSASNRRISHPLFVKAGEFAPNPKLGAERIAKQLNAGAMGIVLVSVESAEETQQGIAAMRFKSKGGTRPDDVGDAPALWGMSEKEYREKADVWPLNPNGELVNFTIIESKEGLAKVREIAAVKGVGVLFPGAGTLGGVFTSTNAEGQRVRDNVAWEAAIQSVLSACKEFNVPCGYPANDSTMMQQRLKEGFTVFITAWGENGFKAVDVVKKASRP